MRYTDGNVALLGDKVAIRGNHRGVVVACIDRSEYLAGYTAEQWSYLGRGVMIDTSFGGLVHYEDVSDEEIVLVERSSCSRT